MRIPFRSLGPGLLVTAAFIGPGTVTTASLAGARFGFDLMWAVAFAVAATIVLQEMSARVGLVSGAGLGEAVRSMFRAPALRGASAALVIVAIGLGNAAYQAGNITGASMGLDAVVGGGLRVWTLAVIGMTLVLLAAGRYRFIERILIALVALMSVVFVITACMVRPRFSEVASGLLEPSIPEGSLTTVIALIGTTVVPYNLFLHASSVRQKWPAGIPREEALRASRIDTVVSISLGGLITVAILVAAAGAFSRGTSLKDAAAMARQLEPLLGPAATAFFAVGLFAAGVTSAITAPLAAAYAVAGIMGWPPHLRDARLRGVWLAVLLIGAIFAFTGRQPVETIQFAQAANGLLLPVIAVLLLVAVNRSDLMGEHRNRALSNVAGVVVVAVAAGLGLYKLYGLAIR